MSHIITLYSHCAGGTIRNDQQSLPLTAGGLGAKILCLLFQEGNYASLIYEVKMAGSLWQVAKIN